MREISGSSSGGRTPVIFVHDNIEDLFVVLACPLGRVILLQRGMRLLDHDPVCQLLAFLLDGLFQSIEEIGHFKLLFSS